MTPEEQARKQAELYYAPSMRDIYRQRTQGQRDLDWTQAQQKQQYGFQKGEIEPEYNRLVNELGYGLNKQLSTYKLAQDQANQTYGQKMSDLAKSNQAAMKRTEADYGRRGLFRSGMLSRANADLGATYGQQQGNLAQASASRLADLIRLSAGAQEKAQFGISAAAGARTRSLQNLQDQYGLQANKSRQDYLDLLSDMSLREQQLGEEQGTRQATTYQDLLAAQQNYQLQKEKLSVDVQQFHHNAYWEQQKFDEDKRRYGLDYALKLQQMNKSYGGGGGGGYGGYSNYSQNSGQPETAGETPENTPTPQGDVQTADWFNRVPALMQNVMSMGSDPMAMIKYLLSQR